MRAIPAVFVVLLLAVTSSHAQWVGEEIGSGGNPGQFTEVGGVFTVDGTGVISGTSDRAYFVYQFYEGNFEFVARLDNLTFPQGTDPAAGLMVRENVDPGNNAVERNVFVMQHSREDLPVYVPFSWADSQHRGWRSERTIGGVRANGTAIGYYHKLIRYDDRISVYVSADGVAWRFVEGYTLTGMASRVKVGMAVATGVYDWNLTPARGTFSAVSLKPLALPYATSWIGNSLPGGSTAVQQNVRGLYVDPNSATGRIYLSCFWDEAAREATIYLPNGDMYGSLDIAHERPSGFAITSNGTYVYMGQKMPGVDPLDYDESVAYGIRRYNPDGSLAPSFGGEGLNGTLRHVGIAPENDHDGHVKGLAWGNGKLYASDTYANLVREYDGDLTYLQAFPASQPLTRPRALTVDGSTGDLWIIADVAGLPKVRQYSSTGAWQRDIHVTGWAPMGLTIADSMLWVADAGPDQQIKKFSLSDGSPAGTFGDPGGLFSGTRGLTGSLKLNNPVNVGVDDAGNIYVASDGSAGSGGVAGTPSGTEFRKFTSSGTLLWARYGLEFVKGGAFDPQTDGHDVYTADIHYVLDYSRPTGEEWTYKGFTVDRFTYPDDFRAHQGEIGARGGVFIRRHNGNRYMFVSDMHATFLATYRFETAPSEVAVPTGLFISKHFLEEPLNGNPEFPIWPTNQPQVQSTRWIWRDLDADARIDSTEYKLDGWNSDIVNWYVDTNMDIWTASVSDNPTIRRYKLRGIDPTTGGPIYDGVNLCTQGFCPVDFSRPPEFAPDPNNFTGVTRAVFVPGPTNTMYLLGYTQQNPLVPPDEHSMGRVLVRYDNWNPEDPNSTGTFVWSRTFPFESTDTWPGTAKSVSLAGNRVYVGMVDRRIHVLDAASGNLLRTLTAGPEVAGESGLIDQPLGVSACQRANGDYLALMEEGYQAKLLLFRESPAALYQNGFSTGGNPFSASSGTGATTQLVSIGGNQAVEFKDAASPQSSNQASLFTLTLNPGNALVDRINAVYGQVSGSTPVSFDLTFKLERRLVSNRPLAITGGIQFNNWDNVNVPQFPTGTPEPSLATTLAYSHDETAGVEVLEAVDRGSIATYRFTVVPNGGVRLITGLAFRFQVQVNKRPPGGSDTTPEAIAIDDLAVSEVVP